MLINTCMVLIFTFTPLARCGHVQTVWMAPRETPPSSVIFVNASTSVGALAYAVENIYNTGILPSGVFDIIWIDSGCDSKQSIGKFTDFLFQNRVDVIFGPPCTKAMIPIAELAAYRDIPVFGWLSNEESLDDKSKLQTLVRSIAPLSAIGNILTIFLSGFFWVRVIVISSVDSECEAYANAFISEIESPYWSSFGFFLAHHYARVDLNATDSTIDNIYSAIKYEGRIIILIVPESELRAYMIRAHAQGMASGDYQFLFIKTTLLSNEELADVESTALWEHGDTNDDAARRGFENLLYLSFGDALEGNSTSTWSAEAHAAYLSLKSAFPSLPDWAQPDIYSPFLYDAVYLYALALRNNGGDPATVNGSTIRQSLENFNFKGLSGDVVMSSNSDRYASITVYDLSESGNFTTVAYYRMTIVNGSIFPESDITFFRWGDGTTSNDRIPLDTPTCGFFNEKCPASPASSSDLAVYIGVSLAAMVLAMMLLLAYRIWKRQKDLQNVVWKIPFKDIDFFVGKQVRSFMNLSRNDSSSDLAMRKDSVGTASIQRHRRLSITSRSDKGTEYTGGTTNADTFSMDNNVIHNSKITVARYRGRLVALKSLRKKKFKTDGVKFLKEMKEVIEFKHANIAAMLGICTDSEIPCVVWEYCSKGSVQDVIEHDDIKLDTMFKISIAVDICKGLSYLHKSDLRFHGNLKSSNCLIDNRWACKLTDFAPRHLQGEDIDKEKEGDDEKYSALLWTAPELLRRIIPTGKRFGSAAGDVYAFAIIAKELICRDKPYSMESHLTAEEIINKVMNDNEAKRFRPSFPQELDGIQTAKQSYAIKKLIQSCWIEDPMMRPTVKTILKTLNKINPYKNSNVIENMVVMMEKYSNQLEEIVAERTEQLQEEKRKTDALLFRMLPRKVAEELKLGKPVAAENFESVTIYFSDIVGFTNLAGGSTPMQVVDLLNSLYTLFDDIIEHYDVYKVETIGDAYMIVSGLPERNENNHANEMAKVALELLDGVKHFQIPHKPTEQLQIRIGLHSGSVCAGVVGLTMPRYCLFGDTVNTASRMESNGLALKIHISATTADLLKQENCYKIVERGKLEVKGKGSMTTYWLEGRTAVEIPESSSGGVSLSDFNALNIQADSVNDTSNSRVSENEEELGEDEPSIKYVSFLNMPSLPNAADISSSDSGLLELFDSEPEDFPST
ncbi:atrial natriuretic peptide receptor 1-like [Saccostrea echinata]|uniref:atrial natriuretic peptide receptor 1-like n=1 Tax=Saccostrea echinata TaxID=191078 RepID=UPI002A7FEAB6|nr:atrial natriuretic peptide receptor 1-like [Saccostrea echinata]